jgi:hypothetical protein
MSAIGFTLLLALISLFFIKSCIDSFTTSSEESQFLKACKYSQLKSEASCKAVEKRNDKFSNEIDERFDKN